MKPKPAAKKKPKRLVQGLAADQARLLFAEGARWINSHSRSLDKIEVELQTLRLEAAATRESLEPFARRLGAVEAALRALAAAAGKP